MKPLLLLCLCLASSVLAQDPPAGPRVAREPSCEDVPKQAASLQAIRPQALPTPTPVASALQSAPRKPAPEQVRSAIAGVQHPPVLFDEPLGDGVHWANGECFKASFAPAEWSYIARPDATAEQLEPITFRLAHARVAGQELTDGTHAAIRREGWRVRMQHGAVVEAIDVSPRHVEQTFHFAKLPQRGELVLDIAVASGMAGSEDTDGLRFRGRWADVTYSRAIAIDADGDRVAASTRLVDGRIEIRVPAEFVATASLPLVVDPIVAGGVVATSTTDVGNPDITWVPQGGYVFVAYQRLFAAGQWDCYVASLNYNFGPLPGGGVAPVDITTNSWTRPRIAHVRANGVSMVVCQQRVGTNPIKVSGRILNNNLSFATTQFDVAAASVDSLVPDIGGDPYPNSNSGYFTVVWEHAYSASDHDIHARQVTASGVLRGTGPTIVQGNAAYQSNPSISKSDGFGQNSNEWASQRHAIVWQEQGIVGGWDIHGSLMSWDGVVQLVGSSSTFPIEASSASTVLPNVSSPTLEDASGTRRFLCVYERAGINAGDIEATAFTSAGAILARANIVALDDNPSRLAWPQNFPSVDTDGYRFAVAYQENWNASPTDLDVRVTTISVGPGELLTVDMTPTAVSSAPEFAPQVASLTSAGFRLANWYGVVNDRDAGGAFYIEGDRYESAISCQRTVRTTACGGGASLSAASSLTTNQENLSFTLTSSSPLAGFAIGTPINVSLPNCNCVLGVDSFATQVGTSLNFAVSDFETALVGFRLSLQGWMLGAPQTSCLSDIHLTNTIDLVVR